MSYMPAEMNDDDDFEFEDGFLLDDDVQGQNLMQSLNSSSKANFGGNLNYASQNTNSNQSHQAFTSYISQPQNQNDHNFTPTAKTTLTKDPSALSPNHQQQQTASPASNSSIYPSSSSSFPASQNHNNKPFKLVHNHRQLPTSESDCISPHNSDSDHLLTAEDFKLACVRGKADIALQCLLQGIPVDQALTSGWSPLMFACNHSSVDVVDLLLKQGADPSFHRDLFTALMCACSTSCVGVARLECVRLMVEAGADVNSKDRQHSTSLMISARLGHVDMVDYLLQKGAKIDEQDARGWTALTWAVQRGHKEVVLTLLEAGADCNVKHSDRLTVKDMAAHSASDEMLALLERRPVRLSDAGDMTSTGVIGHSEAYTLDSNSAMLGEDDKVKSTDLRYGEMEIFLLGLNLPHLVSLFKKHLIDLFLLLDMKEQDLINAGVEQVGARKLILDAARAVHKKDWETTSLVSLHFNKCIGCADAVAMVANAAKHIRYIDSTVVYVRRQLEHHPQAIVQATDQSSPSQLARRLADTRKHVKTLQTDLCTLEQELLKEMKNVNVHPPDLIHAETEYSSFGFNPFVRRLSYLSGLLAFSTAALFVWRSYSISMK